MADISQTPADVETGDHQTVVRVQVGEAVSAGDVVYLDATESNKAKRTDASALASAVAVGMVITKASDDGYAQLMQFNNGSTFKPGGTVVKGQSYGVSTNAGKIAPETDWGASDYMTIIGIGISTSEIRVGLNVTGVQHG